MSNITILSIESSCDDSGAAIIQNGRVLSNSIANQEVHKAFGGVVPEVASRKHLNNIIPVVDHAIKEAGIKLNQIDAIAFTRGPGLLGSLTVGVSFAKAMGLSLNIPIIEVNHMKAHVLANFAEEPSPSFPFLCLTVSGGHTQIVRVDNHLDMTVIGRTVDDAAGEAFDKIGKMLGLPYPAGPVIDRLSEKGRTVYKFTEPKIDGLDFSFSGLKTGVLYFLRKQVDTDPDFIEKNLNDICASVQDRIISILMNKVKKAIDETGIQIIALAGGVSANRHLRNELNLMGAEQSWKVFIPPFEYCTDNAAMIGIAGYYKYLRGDFSDQSVAPAARLVF